MKALLAAAALAAVALTTAQTAPARPIGGHCVSRLVYFDVTAVKLDEQTTEHWTYRDSEDRTATIDTTTTGTVDWHAEHPSQADRDHHRQWAFADDLGSGCRFGDFFEGRFYGAGPAMQYTTTGTWSAGGQTGPCSAADSADRHFRGTWMRLSTRAGDQRLERHLLMGRPPAPDCPFQAFDAIEQTFVTRHLDDFRPGYRQAVAKTTKRALLRHRTLTIPVDETSSGTLSTGNGRVQRTSKLSGVITLRRYKTCVITPLTDLSKTRCLSP